MAKGFSEIKAMIKDNKQKRRWQGSIGLVIFALFVLSSVVVSRTVQALNLAAGNYGYYGGTYGYNASITSSDFLPNPATSLTSSVTTSSVTFSWTAPTLTTGGTSLDNLSGYCYQTGTSSVTTCTLTDSTTTSASLAITGVSCGTTRYIAVRAYDTNNNLSDALTGSASATQCGGGGGGGGGGGATGPTYPTGPTESAPTTTTTTTVTAPSTLSDATALTSTLGVQRDLAAEQSASSSISSSTSEFGVTLTATQSQMATNFVAYGYSAATQKLGSGERLALVRDAFDSLQRFPNDSATFFEQVATSQKPTERNIAREVEQLNKVLPLWEKLMGRRPNFKNAGEDLAWNTMMYRVRFIPRDLNKERIGIGKFRTTFKRLPSSPLDWATVRAWGYSLSAL